jgi:hypothetical protein
MKIGIDRIHVMIGRRTKLSQNRHLLPLCFSTSMINRLPSRRALSGQCRFPAH